MYKVKGLKCEAETVAILEIRENHTIPYVDNDFVNVRLQEFTEKERRKQIIETKTNHKLCA